MVISGIFGTISSHLEQSHETEMRLRYLVLYAQGKMGYRQGIFSAPLRLIANGAPLGVPLYFAEVGVYT